MRCTIKENHKQKKKNHKQKMFRWYFVRLNITRSMVPYHLHLQVPHHGDLIPLCRLLHLYHLPVAIAFEVPQQRELHFHPVDLESKPVYKD